jgi:cytochrome c
MDSWEFSKIAGAVLCALLAIVLPKTLIDMNAESAAHNSHGGHAGYELPAPAGAAKVAAKPGEKPAAGAAPIAVAGLPAAGAAAAGGAGVFDTVKPMFASAKPEGGAATFKICAACHSPDKGGANKVGPALWGIVGRKIGGMDGFNYSEGIKGKGGEWTYDQLVAFINNPKAYAAGTKMAYAGLADPEKLADLMAYLGTLSDTPVPLPK